MSITEKLIDLGYPLPPLPKPVAAYVPAVLHGGLVYVSGQLPLRDGELAAAGSVPREVQVDRAKELAAQCAVNGLAAAASVLDGDPQRIERVVKLVVFVHSEPGFTEQHLVANGASELLDKVFGERGRHARSAVGAAALPLGSPVEVEMVLAAEKPLDEKPRNSDT